MPETVTPAKVEALAPPESSDVIEGARLAVGSLVETEPVHEDVVQYDGFVVMRTPTDVNPEAYGGSAFIRKHLGLDEAEPLPDGIDRWEAERVYGGDDDLIVVNNLTNTGIEGYTMNGVIDSEHFLKVAQQRIDALGEDAGVGEQAKVAAAAIKELIAANSGEIPEVRAGTGYLHPLEVMSQLITPLYEASRTHMREDVRNQGTSVSTQMRRVGDEISQYAMKKLAPETLESLPIERAIARADAVFKSGDYYASQYVIKALFDVYGEEMVSRIEGEDSIDGLAELWDNDGFLESVGFIFKDHLGRSAEPNQEQKALLSAIDREFMKRMGLTEQESIDIRRSLNTYQPKKTLRGRREHGERFDWNYRQMARINSLDDNAVGDLHRRFGIHNFFRYHTETLVRQSQGLNNEAATTLSIGALTDWNNALQEATRPFGIIRVSRGEIIFAEAGSVMDIGRRLLTAREMIGRPLERIAISAHGRKDAIAMGYEDRSKSGQKTHYLTSKDILNSESLAKFEEKGLIEDSSDVLLLSCSTGKRGGLAQEIGEKLKGSDVTIVASGRDSATASELDRDGDSHLYFAADIHDDRRSGREKFMDKITRKPFKKRTSSTVTYSRGKRKRIDSYKL